MRRGRGEEGEEEEDDRGRDEEKTKGEARNERIIRPSYSGDPELNCLIVLHTFAILVIRSKIENFDSRSFFLCVIKREKPELEYSDFALTTNGQWDQNNRDI